MSKRTEAPHSPSASESMITPPLENAALKWKQLSAEQQNHILSLPAHKPEEIQKMLKPGEGLDKVAEKTLDLLEGSPAIAKALKLDVSHLRTRFDERKQLAQYEGTTYKLYRRAAENRMAADSELYSAMLKVNRFVGAAADAELSTDFADLTDWVAGTHRHGSENTVEEPSAKKDERNAGASEVPPPAKA